jgi:hypothetical protein
VIGTDEGKRKAALQERLVELYLRLNGYFLSKFIVHSPVHGHNATEIDVLAVRFPYNAEPERSVESDALLQTSSDAIDLLICEVKSAGQQLQFNKALTNSRAPIAVVLRWAGMYTEDEIVELTPKLRETLLNPDRNNRRIPQVAGPRRSRVRGILASPERDRHRRGQPWFIDGKSLLNHLTTCLRPAVPRSKCATTYDFGAWDRYEEIIRVMKDPKQKPPANFSELYRRIA